MALSYFKFLDSDVDAELLEACFYTSNVSDPDLLIRTSGEVRLSDFLLWQSAESTLYFTRSLWPEFSWFELLQCVLYYQRTRSGAKQVGLGMARGAPVAEDPWWLLALSWHLRSPRVSGGSQIPSKPLRHSWLRVLLRGPLVLPPLCSRIGKGRLCGNSRRNALPTLRGWRERVPLDVDELRPSFQRDSLLGESQR